MMKQYEKEFEREYIKLIMEEYRKILIEASPKNNSGKEFFLKAILDKRDSIVNELQIEDIKLKADSITIDMRNLIYLLLGREHLTNKLKEITTKLMNEYNKEIDILKEKQTSSNSLKL